MSLPHLELIIAQDTAGATTAALRVELPPRRADLVPPEAISLDTIALRSLIVTPDAYGAALTAMVFTPALREGWQRAVGFAEATGTLRVRLALSGDDALHAIRWELLRDPLDHAPLAHTERTPFSRFLSSPYLANVQASARPALRAVVAVANPSALATLGMPEVDVVGEVARAQQGLGDIPPTILDGADGRPAASLPSLAAALRDGAHILYLVCHGTLVGDQPALYLEQEGGGRYQPTDGAALVRQITNLTHRPLLVILAACRGAGDDYATLVAIGPHLARAGVGAVIAMQGNVPMTLVAQLMPRLFTELRRDGQIDRAMAAARAGLPSDSPWWMPTLWMAVNDGALWDDDGTAFARTPRLYPPCPRRVGQQPILADLQRRLQATTTSPPAASAVLLESPPGYGKHALLRELAVACASRGGVVLGGDWSLPPNSADPDSPVTLSVPAEAPGQIATAWPQSVAAAGASWQQVMAQAQTAQQRLLTPHRLGVTDDPSALLAALLAVANHQPVLLCLEHWGWAGDTWDILLGELIAAIQRSPMAILVVLTRDHRPVTSAHTLPSALDVALACGEVGSHHLSRASADDLRAALGPAHLDLIATLHTLSEGHPALAMTLWDEWQGVGAIRKDRRGIWQPTGTSPWVAESLRALALRLLRACLPAGAALTVEQLRHALAIAALEGPIFTVQAVAEVAGVDVNHLLDIFDDDLLGDDPDVRILAEIGPVPQPEHLVRQRLDRYGFARPYLQLVFARELRGTAQEETALALAMALERHYQPAPERAAESLARLFDLGGDPTRAEAYQKRHAQDTRERAQEAGLRWRIAALLRDGNTGQPVLYEAYIAFADWLHEHIRYAEAVTETRAALEIAEGLPDARQIARALSWMGNLLHAQGDLDGARPYYERALAIREQVRGPTHPETARSLNNLGAVLYAQGDLAGTRPYLERALAIREHVLGPTHPETALSLNNMGYLLLQAQGDLDGARPYYERALAIWEQVLGPTHPDTARSLNNMGYLLQAQGDLDGARPYYERALAIFTARLGPQHPDTQNVQRNLAALDAPQKKQKDRKA